MKLPARSVRVARDQDTFLAVAICTILLIRLQLWATDYPQLGGGKLHIAHLLWGGLFLVVTVLMLSSFVGRRWRTRGAILGGIGFGFFIDEVGKFITKDNDYFFQPSAVIIYVVFLILFGATRWIQRSRTHTPEEAVANAIDIFGDIARPKGLAAPDRGLALALLARAPHHHATPGLRRLILETPPRPAEPPSRLARLVLQARKWYDGIVDTRWFFWTLTIVFSLWAAANLATVLSITIGIAVGAIDHTHGARNGLRFVDYASTISAAVASGIVVAGVLKLRAGSQLAALEHFGRALMVTVFITEPFDFAASSFSAATGMVVAIVLLLTVRYMQGQEERRRLELAQPELWAPQPVSAG